MHRHHTLSTICVTLIVTVAFYIVPLGVMSLAVHLGWYADPTPAAAAQPATTGITPVVAGDDNGDGVIDEDESGWDCSTMGNHVCGPVPA